MLEKYNIFKYYYLIQHQIYKGSYINTKKKQLESDELARAMD